MNGNGGVDQHTVLMAVARNIGAAAPSIKEGKWERSKFVGVEAKGKTLGIIGLGKGIPSSSILY